MLKKIKSKKGQISVLMVVFIMILCYMLAGMVDIANRQWGIEETQSKIDIAGMNALYGSINLDSLRLETLEISGGGGGIGHDGAGADTINPSQYEPVVKKAYRDELTKVTYGGKSPAIRYTDVDFEYSNFGLGYKGNTAKQRPQVVLESVVSYTVDTSTLTDKFTGTLGKEISSSHANTDFKVTVTESAKDGKAELLIHSITRLVLK